MWRRVRFWLLIVTALAVVACSTLIIGYQMRQPPIGTLRTALQAVTEAKASEGHLQAAILLRQAELNLEIGQAVLRAENANWWPFGSYYKADSLLRQATILAKRADSTFDSHIERRQGAIVSDAARLADSVKQWRQILDSDLAQTDGERLYRIAQLQNSVAQNLVRSKKTDAASAYLDSLRHTLNMLDRRHRQNGGEIGKRNGEARRWAAETISHSKATGTAAIIVDKSKHRLYVITAGKVVNSYPCELGYNSGHQKRLSGDGATPEGQYKVTEVKRRSKYYRALLLNYPNEADRVRFRQNKKEGVIPAYARIGGLIEIHGHGGQGKDWTEGCVAVADNVMDKLLQITGNGTRVTIVRSWER
jgi:L,D-peptidoglycan transpeptidase YkuD (ErfK/YbiS/YcfS/YnhG family)